MPDLPSTIPVRPRRWRGLADPVLAVPIARYLRARRDLRWAVDQLDRDDEWDVLEDREADLRRAARRVAATRRALLRVARRIDTINAQSIDETLLRSLAAQWLWQEIEASLRPAVEAGLGDEAREARRDEIEHRCERRRARLG